MMTKIWIIKFSLLALISLSIHAKVLETYTWNGNTYKLPLPKSWLSKKPRKSPKDPLVFLDIDTSNPRIIVSLYGSNYDVSPKDLSDFKAQFLKSKNKWLKENNAELSRGLTFAFDKKTEGLYYEYEFSSTYGVFKEIGHFMKCQSGPSAAIKAMIPEKRRAKAQKLALEQMIKEIKLCPSSQIQ